MNAKACGRQKERYLHRFYLQIHLILDEPLIKPMNQDTSSRNLKYTTKRRSITPNVTTYECNSPPDIMNRKLES
jgi:hypothetical protein